MSRSLCLPVVLALGLANSAWAASPAGAGVKTLGDLPSDHPPQLTIRVYATLPAGSVIICKVRLEGPTVPSGSDQMAVGAVVVAGSSQCALELRNWSGSWGHQVLSYEIEAERPGMHPRTIAAGTAFLPMTRTGPTGLDLDLQLPPQR